jgi:DNA mismatch repair protein MutS2
MLHSSTMDSKSLRTLEFPLILERLAEYAAFSASKELARELKPSNDPDWVQLRLDETSEARHLFSLQADLTIGGARDVRDPVESAERGVVLEPHQILDVKNTLIAARTLRRRFEDEETRYPALRQIALRMAGIDGLIDSISRVLSERGEILDKASDLLATIRRDMRVAHGRLTEKLQGLLGDPKIQPLLQEPIITQREGRYVIPLRAEFKGRLKSIVHDQSTSGATVFVEPLQVVDLNNQLRELELAERDEIRRLLAELSARIGEHSGEIQDTVAAIAEIDLAFAKARYAEYLKASEPIIVSFPPERGERTPQVSRLKLVQARHPLLDPDSVVPVDLVLDEETRALVITGPNTGGKTVTLKTGGLLVLMAASGMHIPATSGSMLSLFDAVYADIGDEQSIEQSLSTFSAHISNIIHILQNASKRSLVLLDELGAGTDPQEGAALAQALLETMLERGVTTLVATHFTALKTFAHVTEGVRNASVEFDLESLQPTYHLTIGLPGRSNALAIAQRLGLDEEVLEKARQWVSAADLETDTLLDEIHHQREQARRAMQEAEQASLEARERENELTRRLDSIEDERRELLEQARQSARSEVEELRSDLEKLRRQMHLAGQPLEALNSAQQELEDLEQKAAEPVVRETHEYTSSERPLQLGDKVHLTTIDTDGTVTSLAEDQAEVQVGRLRIRAKLDELRLADDKDRQVEDQPSRQAEGTRVRSKPTAQPSLELHLRGMRVDEALIELERYLDSAYLAGMPFVRVVHGKGTGTLREAVRNALRDNRYVRSFESGRPSEGGEGVTVVHLDIG